MEELVCSAWCEVLGLDQVCVVTPFADYGGNSLIANRLTVAVSARLDTTVRPRDLLVEPTVRAQAERLARGVDDDSAELAWPTSSTTSSGGRRRHCWLRARPGSSVRISSPSCWSTPTRL
ncbi:acyl carrier protein [Kibdelosporangium aridum]|uniref:acyl carrier protein n=1 Tax=Kibdelosporangium aridum TaxID=2030 RepID=UPI0035E4D0EE